jgi:intraflagellar transport protein 88
MPVFAVLVVDIFYLNLAGLKFLIRLCSDLGIKEAAQYALELKKAEKAKEVRERIGSSRPGE